MSGNRFILSRRTFTISLALLLATGVFLGLPAASQTRADSSPPSNLGTFVIPADSAAGESSIPAFPGSPALLQGGITGVWTETNTPIDEANTPTRLYAVSMAALPGGNVLLFGGYHKGGDHVFGDTWIFNSGTNTWGQVATPSAPKERAFASMASTPSGVLLFGGMWADDTWLYALDTGWLPLTDTSSTPTALIGGAMASTPSGVILFGGYPNFPTYPLVPLQETWIFNTQTNTWGQVATPSAPPERGFASMAALPDGNVLLYGGVGNGDLSLNDTWIFNTQTNTWGQVATPSAPSERYLVAMASTPSGVVLFGGMEKQGTDFDDTWFFTPDIGWDLLSDTGSTPPVRSVAGMASTPSGAVLFGGMLDPVSELYFNDTWLFHTESSSSALYLTSPLGRERWTISSAETITWTSTGLNSTTLTILLARNGVDFTETLTTSLDAGSSSWTWTVTDPGTINAKVRVQQDATEGTSPDYFTITSTLFPYIGGTTTLTTSDPWLEISGGSGTGTLWVTPLDPQYTSDPDLGQFIQETGKRSALFFDIGQEGLSGTLTIVLHFNHRLGEETFQLYLWDGVTGWALVPNGILNLANHTFTFTIDAALLLGTPFALGGDPAAMPGLNPWALALLSLALLGMGGWWFLRRRGVA